MAAGVGAGSALHSACRQAWCWACLPALFLPQLPWITAPPCSSWEPPNDGGLRKTKRTPALPANIRKRDSSGGVSIKGGRGARETSRPQQSALQDSVEEGCYPQTARRGPRPPPRKALGPDTLARDTLHVIIFIHFLFLKIKVNIQYIFSMYIRVTVGGQKNIFGHLEAVFNSDILWRGKNCP